MRFPTKQESQLRNEVAILQVMTEPIFNSIKQTMHNMYFNYDKPCVQLYAMQVMLRTLETNMSNVVSASL